MDQRQRARRPSRAARRPLPHHNQAMSSPSTASALPGLRSPAVGFEQPFEMLGACHERVQRSLDLLARLVEHLRQRAAAATLDRTDGSGVVDANARSAATDVARYFNLAAPQHHLDEERHVIPRLQRSDQPALQAAAAQMLADHAQIEAIWSRLAPLLAAVATPAGASVAPAPDLAALAAAAEDFIALHARHLPLEDGLAFPAARQGLDETALAAMGREMALRRRPSA